MPYHRPLSVINSGHNRPAGRLIGRARQLAVLDDLVDGLFAGRPARVGISGAAGTGRTALLRRLLATARDRGAVAGLATCSPVEAGIPFSTASQLVAALHPPARFADLATECFAGPCEGTVPLLCDVFAELAVDGPLVLAVDDLQWADAWSLQCLTAMAARPGPILLVAAAHGPLSHYLGDDAGPGTRHQLDLPPLTEADATALLRETPGEPGGAAFTAAVLSIAAGRPAVLRDIVARWTSGGHGPEPEQVPHLVRIGRAVTSARAARVRRGLPPDALALLRAMSVSTSDVVLAGRLAGLPESAVTGALEPLVASGLVAAGRPAEPHLAAEVLAELDADARGDLHRRAAELAHGTGAGATVAADLLRAAPAVGEPWARTVLVEAAEQWFLQGRTSASADALRRALLEPLEPADRAALLLRLASMEVTQDPDAADGRLRRILAEPELSTLPAAVTAADLLLARGDVETTRRAVSELRGRAEAHARSGEPAPESSTMDTEIRDPARRAADDSSTVDSDLIALGRLAEEEAAVDPEMPVAPLRWPTRPGGPAEAGAEAWRLATRGEDRRRALDLAEQALIVREDAPLMPRIAACRALLCCDEPESAAEGLTAVAAAARRRDARTAAAQALLYRAVVDLRRNRPEDALHDLTAAGRELPVRSWHPALVPAYLAVEISAHLKLGRVERARRLAAEPLPRGGEHTAAPAFLLYARAELALAADEPEAALAAARECGRILRSRQWVNPMLAPWRTFAAFALRTLGDAAAASALVAEEQALAGHWGTVVAFDSLRERAVAELRRSVPAQRRPVEPVPEPVLPAGRRFEPRRPEVLSPAEQDVAALAARGLPNREIARELSIALRTVELRLTKVYRKLGLKGRSALTERWATWTRGD
ncbi:AAA family ATPase [Amycolatopsis sp. NBC_00355]|uniref:AAA family ATPase n=1 Tax=Amycolatopsis sp. NBC_00355 TaxID=2975957 RepID=UPI002E25E156